MWLLAVGIILLIIASFWHSYYAIGTLASPVHTPIIFYSNSFLDRILRLGWLLLFIVGTTLLFIGNWIVAIIAIPIYWFLLPIFTARIVRKWMLPSWNELSENLQDTLKRMGYDKHNYLDGYWWRRDFTEKEFDKLLKGE